MVTVALDATPLLGSRTGVGVAVAGLVRSLAVRSDVSLTGYALTGAGSQALRAVSPPGIRIARGRMPAAVLLRLWKRVDEPPSEWWTGPVDVVHGSNFVVPPTRQAARLVSVWDLTAVRYPELCTPTSLRYPALIARALGNGATAHTGSQFVADEIIDHFRVDASRVRVVAPGVSGSVSEAPAGGVDGSDGPADADGTARVSGRPYVLGLGTAEPRKDFPGLVRAFDRIARAHPDLELRIAGPAGWGEDELSVAMAAAVHHDRIHRLGWVPDAGPLLRGAAVFCYPSRYEGFGFPPLEAMAAGVPVVATAAGSVPEVVGDAARLVPVGDTDALAEAIERVLVDSDERARLIAAGSVRVAQFTWPAAATGMAALYRELAGAR